MGEQTCIATTTTTTIITTITHINCVWFSLIQSSIRLGQLSSLKQPEAFNRYYQRTRRLIDATTHQLPPRTTAHPSRMAQKIKGHSIKQDLELGELSKKFNLLRQFATG